MAKIRDQYSGLEQAICEQEAQLEELHNAVEESTTVLEELKAQKKKLDDEIHRLEGLRKNFDV